MKRYLLMLVGLVFVSGCCMTGRRMETRYPPWSYPSSYYFNWEEKPSDYGEYRSGDSAMTAAAAEVLGVVEPVEVDDFSGVGKRPARGEKICFLGERVVQGVIHDADGRYIALRIEDNPKYDSFDDSCDEPKYRVFLKRYRGRGLGAVLLNKGAGEESEITMQDRRLAAFAVLCREWVSRNFTLQEARSMRYSVTGDTNDQSTAKFLMWYFDPVESDEGAEEGGR